MRIGIAVDGSSPSRAGVELVASLPLRGTDRVSVIAVAQPPAFLAAPFGHVPPVAGFLEVMGQAAEARARSIAEHAAERLIGLPCPVTPIVRIGHPVQVLLHEVDGAGLDLLVLGPRGQGSLSSIVLGSVSQALLHAMPTAILIARPPTGSPTRVILAADGSPPSLVAATYLRGFPLPADVDLRVVVSVTPGTDPYRDLEARDFRALRQAEREEALRIARRVIDVLEAPGRHPVPMIREGDPKREILDAAVELDTDLIVTGARGAGGFKDLVLGSVSRAVSKAAPCSVLVVGGPRVESA